MILEEILAEIGDAGRFQYMFAAVVFTMEVLIAWSNLQVPGWMTARLTGGLVGWVAGRLVGWLVGRLLEKTVLVPWSMQHEHALL